MSEPAKPSNGKPPLAERARELAGQGRAAASGATEAVLEHARENPYPALAAAFGLGYVLGGGLFSKTTARVLGLGLKLAAVPAVQAAVLDVVEVALEGALAQGRKLVPTEDRRPAASAPPGAPQA